MDKFFDAIRRINFRRGPARFVGGIAGGLAAKADVNLALVRILVLLSFLLPFVGLGAYLVVWLLTPWQDNSIPLERFLSAAVGQPRA